MKYFMYGMGLLALASAFGMQVTSVALEVTSLLVGSVGEGVTNTTHYLSQKLDAYSKAAGVAGVTLFISPTVKDTVDKLLWEYKGDK